MLRRTLLLRSLCVLSMWVRRAYEARLVPTTVTVSTAGALVCIVVASVAGFGCATASELARYPPTPPITASVSKPDAVEKVLK